MDPVNRTDRPLSSRPPTGSNRTSTGQTTTRRWPTGTEYAEAVQQPGVSFSDPELRAGALTLTPLGIPAMASGQNAVAFHFEAETRPVAVRCLLSENGDGRYRYQALQSHLEANEIPCVVPAQWLDEGVRVHASWWPVVVMPWVSGRPLHDAIEDRLGDPERLTSLADRWFDLAESLQAKQFAHGDLQHGNVLLTDDDQFQLVDLDGIWVPNMTVGAPGEFGHPNYQHAQRSALSWGPHVDTFSALVIGLSMAALGSDPSLARFMTGENLLFMRSDFEDVDQAPIWKALAASSDHEVADLAQRLIGFTLGIEPPTVGLREALAADATIVRPTVETVAAATSLPGSTTEQSNWWETPATPATDGSATDSYWASPENDRAAAEPDPTTAVEAVPAGSTGGAVKATGLARLTGRPAIAGVVGGGVAGIVGCLVAGILQAAFGTPSTDAALFVGSIAAFLGGFVAAWPSLNVKAYGAAAVRFSAGLAAGLFAGVTAVLIADQVMNQVLTESTDTNIALVTYLWALTAALIGFAVGLLRSPKAAALAFTGGFVAGAIGGFVHGSTAATFDNGVLVINASDPATVLVAIGISAFVGLVVALALRSARSGSFTVIEGPGQGSVIDFHKKKATIGSAVGDTLVLAKSVVPAAAVTIRLTDRGATANAAIPVQLDGQLQPESFQIEPEQVIAVGGVFVRVSFKKEVTTP